MWIKIELSINDYLPSQIQTQFDDTRQEAELYRSQLNSERHSNKNLEGLLQNNRGIIQTTWYDRSWQYLTAYHTIYNRKREIRTAMHKYRHPEL